MCNKFQTEANEQKHLDLIWPIFAHCCAFWLMLQCLIFAHLCSSCFMLLSSSSFILVHLDSAWFICRLIGYPLSILFHHVWLILVNLAWLLLVDFDSCCMAGISCLAALRCSWFLCKYSFNERKDISVCRLQFQTMQDWSYKRDYIKETRYRVKPWMSPRLWIPSQKN